MLFFVQFDVAQPENVTNAELFSMWEREAAAALGAVEAGAIKQLYKVAGRRRVLAVIEMASAEDLDRALGGLPIFREMGSSVTTSAVPVYDYATFAQDISAGVHSG